MEFVRKPVYDNLCREAIDKINGLPENEQTKADIVEIKEALFQVLAETDMEKLQGYYDRIDEFYSVNFGKGLEYLSGRYLITGAY